LRAGAIQPIEGTLHAAAALVKDVRVDHSRRHILVAIFAPTAWGGLAIGLAAGAWTGYKGGHPGEGLAWGIGLLLLALFAWVALEGVLFLGLFFLFLIPFLGAIPLAIGYLLTYALATMLKDFIEKRARS
jgi:hypothetical protein